LSAMDSTHADDHIDSFVLGLLRTGWMLFELTSNLIEATRADAYPGEEPAAVVLEMICGTIRTAIGPADPRDVRRACELIDEAGARVIEHLRLALELSRQVHRDEGGAGWQYG
jgi:hypothetical protein